MKRTLCMLLMGLMLSLGHASRVPGEAQNSGAAIPVKTSTQTSPIAASGNPPPTGDSASPGSTPAVAADPELQAQIQDALGRDPSLSSNSVKVAASADAIELSGNVASGRERLTAGRIAQSYARGKKVINHIVVSGRNGSAPPPPNPQDKINANPPASLISPGTASRASRSNPL